MKIQMKIGVEGVW